VRQFAKLWNGAAVLPDAFQIMSQLSSSAVIVCVITFLFWNADHVLSDAGRKIIYKRIADAASNPTEPEIVAALQEFIGRYYSPSLPFVRILWNLSLFSACAIIIMLTVYLANTKSLLLPIINSVDLRDEYIKEVVGYGFVTVLVVNCIAYLIVESFWNMYPNIPLQKTYLFVIAEITIKVVLFVAVSAAMVILFGQLRDLGRSPFDGLKLLPNSMLGALSFRDDTGVYFYAVAISSFPTFIVALVGFMGGHPRFARAIRGILFWFNFENRPIRTLSVALSLMLSMFVMVIYMCSYLFFIFTE
jgi:hypothetical protein